MPRSDIPLRQWSDARIVRECRIGNEPAWDELIRRFGPMIYGISHRYRLAAEDCVDVFGRVCLILLENLNSLRDATRLPGYVATTTQRECLAVLRENERQTRISTELENDPSTVDDFTVEPPDRIAQAALQGHVIRRAMEMQDDKCRKLLWHLFFDPSEPEYGEISEILDMPVSSIGPTRGRCLEKFRRTLTRLGFTKKGIKLTQKTLKKAGG